ncbi:MAG: hypothetical protein GC202_09045 [Alphaproteobacteria bacterium]|nr:hypothetical protein [Alphaproteobacteria bacterium]
MQLRLLRRRDFTSDTGSLLVAALTVCAVAVLWIFVVANVHLMQQADADKARDDAVRVVGLIEGDVARTFEVAITALLRAADSIGRADSIDRFARVLADVRPAHPEISSFALADSLGRGHAVTRRGVHGYDAADGEAFKHLSASKTHDAYLSLPFRGGRREVEQVAVARRLENGAGDFDGIIAVTLDYSFVERMLYDERLGSAGTIALHRLDKVLFARAPGLHVPVGRSTADAAVWKHYPQADEGMFEVAASSVDGTRRIVAFRRVRNLPLLAVVTLAQADLDARAAGIARTPYRAAAAASLALAALGFVGMLSTRRLYRQRRLSEARRLAAERARARAVRARNEAEMSSRAKSMFLANMSHELRTPLNAVLGFAETIGAGIVEPAGPRTRAYAADITKSGERLLELVEELLGATELETDSGPIERERVDVRAVARQIVDAMARSFSSRRVAVEIVGDSGAPVFLNQRALAQIFKAILANAARFAPPNGRVRVGLARSPGALEVAISDNGPGLPPEIAASLGEKFSRRGGAMTASASGAGLGLWIARTLIERLDGKLWAEETPGGGATFAMRFPLPAATPQAAAGTPDRTKAAG